MPSLTRVSRRLALLLPLVGTGCGEDMSPGPMPPLRYDYLMPLRLNVAAVDIGDAPPPSPIEAQSPVPAGMALRQMALDRLTADGASGRAVFVIDTAQISQSAGGLSGIMAVHLDILATDGARVGFAEARVSRTATARGNLRRALYDLTRQMMDDMNVEFEFELRRSLREWLQDVTAAPTPGPVEQQEMPVPLAP
jgi:hypothetical protein